MKKIPTLFTRVFEGRKIVDISDEITPGCEEAFKNGMATVKIDGSCCAVINGELYKRYDAKKGKKPPVDAIPCCDPDPVTGHWPHWVKADRDNPSDKWFWVAYDNSILHYMGPDDEEWQLEYPEDGTYEAVGKHFNGNPYNRNCDFLVRHGDREAEVNRTFEGVREWLVNKHKEGLVFWLNGEPVCKIKRTDFGLKWPVERKEDAREYS